MIRLFTTLGALSISAAAFAGFSASHEWVQVDNTVGNPGADGLNGAAWNSNNWVTYDLYLQGDFMLNGVNLGSAPGEDHLGINFDTAVFNTSGFVASDFETAAQQAFAASLYDTYVTLGGNNAGGAAPNELLGIGLNGLQPVNGVLRGAWAHNPANGGSAVDASQGVRILRISFDGDALAGGGALGTGIIEIGTPQGVFEYIIVVPAPGAAGVLALSALAATRRRR
ncbi:MAG: hypothetical protein ACTS27_04890 [Phycisphaerales bacterium]